MYQRLYEHNPSSAPSSHLPDSTLRMLQILRNEPGRTLLMSWPPDPHYPDPNYPTPHPSANDLGQLIKNVKIEGGGGGEAKTSCSRRFRSTHYLNVPAYGTMKSVQVDSIFIPHGESPF